MSVPFGSADPQAFVKLFHGEHIFVSKPDVIVDGEPNVPWHYHEAYETAEKKLREREEFGWGSFFCVNELDRSKDPGTKDKPKHRTKRMFERARAIFLDFDKSNNTPPDNFPIPPNIVVNSSPGKYHYYWLTSTTDADAWNKVMDGLVRQYDGDPQAKDLSRILRVPGFKHQKGEPFLVTYKIHHEDTYTWDEIKTAFPPLSGQDQTNSPSGPTSGSKLTTPPEKFSPISAINEILTAENYHGGDDSIQSSRSDFL